MSRLARAAAAAYRVLLAQRVHTLPVNPLVLLRRCRETVVWTYAEAAGQMGLTEADFERLFGTAEAFTLQEGERYIVAYRAGGNPARLRFTLAHELGHRVLGHRGADALEEKEADVFASHLLCPRPALAQMGTLTAGEIAAACYVSMACAREVLRADDPLEDVDLAEQVAAMFPDAAAKIGETASQRRR